MVISVRNPVHSVLFLILTFLGVSGLLLLSELDFLPLMFIIIYVGAIAVLFLFVVMMLDIKISEIKGDSFKYLPLGSFLGFIFCFEVLINTSQSIAISTNDLDFFLYDINWLTKIDYISNIKALGQLLYTHYFLYFLESGIILLVAMVGAIVLTLEFEKKPVHKQFIFRQLSRDPNKSIHYIEPVFSKKL
jgi:NADH-quinone oxidoreductase subunit J